MAPSLTKLGFMNPGTDRVKQEQRPTAEPTKAFPLPPKPSFSYKANAHPGLSPHPQASNINIIPLVASHKPRPSPPTLPPSPKPPSSPPPQQFQLRLPIQ